MALRHLLAAGLVLVSGLAQAQESAGRFWGDAWRGWHFYEDPAPELARLPKSAPKRPASALKTVPPISAVKAPELMEFERLKKALEDIRNIAIMRPTEANVRHYMELEAQVVARASTFADVAQRIAWSTSELDPTVRGRPVNAKALEVFEQQQHADRSRSITELGRDHVLIFFFRGDCPYCHAFAPTLETFRARHGIRIEPVSLDGGLMPGFPDARRDNGIATALRVTQVPAVYLAQPFSGKITPIGFGVLSEAQLLERITIISSQVAEMPPSISTSQATLR